MSAEARQQPGPDLAIYCLGEFRVYQNDRLISEWNGSKGTAIFKYLIANRNRPVAKEILMDLFWPDADLEVARRNLHQAIYGLRQTLRQNLPDCPYILFENDCYRINPSLRVWVDYEEFERYAQAGQKLEAAGKPMDMVAALAVAEQLYRGDFLAEDLYLDWPRSLREFYHRMYLDLTGRLSSFYLAQRQYIPAAILCQKVLAIDHCNEQACAGMMRCYLVQGQRQLAIREYQACARALQEELGLQPGEELRALYRQITGVPVTQ